MEAEAAAVPTAEAEAVRLSIRLRRRAGGPGVLACLGLQSTGGRRRLVQVTGVHDTLEGAITHCAGRAVHLACGGGGWGWVSGRPGRRQAGLTAGGHGMPGCVEEADVGACGSSTATELFGYDFVVLRDAFSNLLDANSSEGGGYLSNPNCVSWIPRFAPLASSAGNQDQTVLSALTTLVVLPIGEYVRSGFVALRRRTSARCRVSTS